MLRRLRLWLPPCKLSFGFSWLLTLFSFWWWRKVSIAIWHFRMEDLPHYFHFHFHLRLLWFTACKLSAGLSWEFSQLLSLVVIKHHRIFMLRTRRHHHHHAIASHQIKRVIICVVSNFDSGFSRRAVPKVLESTSLSSTRPYKPYFAKRTTASGRRWHCGELQYLPNIFRYTDMVNELATLGDDPNHLNEFGEAPLCVAAFKG